jgi:hypothetical protein
LDNPSLLGIVLATFFSDVGREMATATLPLCLGSIGLGAATNDGGDMLPSVGVGLLIATQHTLGLFNPCDVRFCRGSLDVLF